MTVRFTPADAHDEMIDYARALLERAQEVHEPVIGFWTDMEMVAYADDDPEGVIARFEAVRDHRRALGDEPLGRLRAVGEDHEIASIMAARAHGESMEAEVERLRAEVRSLTNANVVLRLSLETQTALEDFEPENPAEQVLYTRYLRATTKARSYAEALRSLTED